MKRILIVEDDDSISDLQKDYLEMNNYIVEISANGKEALNLIKTQNFDLVILDIMLPEMDGFEILKNLETEKLIPIILVSAKKEEFDKVKGFRLGADDYMTKPFSPSELVARVTAHISKYEKLKYHFKKDLTTNNIIVIRGLTIDIESRRAYLNNKEVFLAQKEFELLLFMARNPNKVFTRDSLFESVWGQESFGDSATVTVHIGRIREKIEANPTKPQYLETVWGAGYRFKV